MTINTFLTMKTLLSLVLSFCLCISVFAQQTETRTVKSFTKLSIAVPAEVHLSKGPFKVTLDGDDLSEIETYVKGGELVIKHKNTSNWSFFSSDADDIVIYITMPELEGISMSGSGKLESKDQFSSKSMKLRVSGSGSLQVNVATGQLEAHVSGSGKIETAGTAQNFIAHISGSGKVKAEELRAQVVDVHISGSGSCYVHADNELEAHISGSGNVYYTGNPTNVNARTSGSGKISKRG